MEEQKNYDVYVGYILTKRIVPGFDYIVPHVFNVRDGKVYEFTRLPKESINSVTEYFGKPYSGRLKDIWKINPTPKKVRDLAEKV